MIIDAQEGNEQVKANSFELEELKAALPQYFDGEGNFKFDSFQKMLGDQEIQFSKESYELNFLGKSYGKYLAGLSTETVLVPDVEHNERDENKDSENLYITGDNLDALKHLKKSYKGAFKCIYIDPPYNTGEGQFIYNDDFGFTIDDLMDKVGLSESEAARVLDLNGKSSHSAWLTFMLPRLWIARHLLSPDGVIFISIDDNEQANLKLLCDLIFGEDNALTRITWESKSKSQNTKEAKTRLQPRVESILVYKNFDTVAHFALDVKSEKTYPFEDELGSYRHYQIGQMANGGVRGRDTMVFPILGVDPAPGMQWKLGKDSIDSFDGRGDLFLLDGVPTIKMRPDDEDNNSYVPFWSHFFDKETYGTAESANRELKDLYGESNVFDTVKPTPLIKKLIRHMRGLELDPDFAVLDFFSGSATTADAVMQTNAELGTCIKYVLVQIADSAENNKVATDLGFSTIDELARDRIKRSAAKIKEDTGAEIDYGFKHFKLETPEDNPLDNLKEFVDSDDLFSDNPLDRFDFGQATAREVLLTTWINQDGYGLLAKPETITLDTYNLEVVGSTAYALDEGMTTKDVIELVRLLESNELKITQFVYFTTALEFHTLTEVKNSFKQLRNDRSITLTARW